jgi:hypothetical protein
MTMGRFKVTPFAQKGLPKGLRSNPTATRPKTAIPFDDDEKSPAVAYELQPKRREPWFRPALMIGSGPTRAQGWFGRFKTNRVMSGACVWSPKQVRRPVCKCGHAWGGFAKTLKVFPLAAANAKEFFVPTALC